MLSPSIPAAPRSLEANTSPRETNDLDTSLSPSNSYNYFVVPCDLLVSLREGNVASACSGRGGCQIHQYFLDRNASHSFVRSPCSMACNIRTSDAFTLVPSHLTVTSRHPHDRPVPHSATQLSSARPNDVGMQKT